MLISWDEPKRLSNLRDHGLDFKDAKDRFDWRSAVTRESHPGRRGEARYKALGFLDRRLVALVFAALGSEAISFISLRPASRAERRDYDQG